MRSTIALIAGLIVLSLSVTAEAKSRCRSSSSGTYKKQGYSGGHSGGYSSGYSRGRAVVVVTQAPTPTVSYSSKPCHTSYGYGYGYRSYGYRPHRAYGYNTYVAPSYPTYRPRRAFATRTPYESSVEIGLRGIAGGTNTGADEIVGLGTYVRVHGGQGYLALEGSIDSTAVVAADGSAFGRVPVLGAAMLYLNPQSPVKIYGLFGGGLSFQETGAQASQALTVQTGGGIDIDLGPRATLTADVRAINDLESSATVSPLTVQTIPDQFVVGNLGISLKF